MRLAHTEGEPQLTTLLDIHRNMTDMRSVYRGVVTRHRKKAFISKNQHKFNEGIWHMSRRCLLVVFLWEMLNKACVGKSARIYYNIFTMCLVSTRK